MLLPWLEMDTVHNLGGAIEMRQKNKAYCIYMRLINLIISKNKEKTTKFEYQINWYTNQRPLNYN